MWRSWAVGQETGLVRKGKRSGDPIHASMDSRVTRSLAVHALRCLRRQTQCGVRNQQAAAPRLACWSGKSEVVASCVGVEGDGRLQDGAARNSELEDLRYEKIASFCLKDRTTRHLESLLSQIRSTRHGESDSVVRNSFATDTPLGSESQLLAGSRHGRVAAVDPSFIWSCELPKHCDESGLLRNRKYSSELSNVSIKRSEWETSAVAVPEWVGNGSGLADDRNMEHSPRQESRSFARLSSFPSEHGVLGSSILQQEYIPMEASSVKRKRKKKMNKHKQRKLRRRDRHRN